MLAGSNTPRSVGSLALSLNEKVTILFKKVSGLVESTNGTIKIRLARIVVAYSLPWPKADAGRDWGQEEKGTTEDEMGGWYHQLNGHEFE